MVGLTVFRRWVGGLGAIRVIGRLENLGKDKLTKFLKFHILTIPQARPKAHRGRVVFTTPPSLTSKLQTISTLHKKRVKL